MNAKTNLLIDSLTVYRGLIFEAIAFIGLVALVFISLFKGAKRRKVFKRAVVYIAISIILLLSTETINTIKSYKTYDDYAIDMDVINDISKVIEKDGYLSQEKIRKIIFQGNLSIGFELCEYQDTKEAIEMFRSTTESYENHALIERYDNTEVFFSGYYYDKTSILVPIEPSEWRAQLIICVDNYVLRFSERESRKSKCDMSKKISTVLKQYNSTV